MRWWYLYLIHKRYKRLISKTYPFISRWPHHYLPFSSIIYLLCTENVYQIYDHCAACQNINITKEAKFLPFFFLKISIFDDNAYEWCVKVKFNFYALIARRNVVNCNNFRLLKYWLFKICQLHCATVLRRIWLSELLNHFFRKKFINVNNIYFLNL